MVNWLRSNEDEVNEKNDLPHFLLWVALPLTEGEMEVSQEVWDVSVNEMCCMMYAAEEGDGKRSYMS